MYYTLFMSSIPVVAIMILMDLENNIMALSLYKNVYYACIIRITVLSLSIHIQILNCGQSSHALIHVDYHAPLPSHMIVIKDKAIQTIRVHCILISRGNQGSSFITGGKTGEIELLYLSVAWRMATGEVWR